MILIGITPIYADEQFRGYVKHDIYLEDLKYKLYKGEQITCVPDAKQNECCYEDEAGTICLKLDYLSSKKVKKVDIYFDSIYFSDDALAEIDVCKNGQPLQKQSDSFVWSYGFRVKSSEPIPEDVLIEVTLLPVKEGMAVHHLSFSKILKGKVDGKCHIVTITKDDIDSFLKKYQNVAKYLAIELDLNVPVNVILQIFSERPEDNYKNNIAIMRTVLPADNNINWPPRTLSNIK